MPGTFHLAEGVGFEPTDGFPSPVFKTGAFVHSAIPPSSVPVRPVLRVMHGFMRQARTSGRRSCMSSLKATG
jgi:hypothetical protein